MTNRERYKQAFGALHASGEINLEADMKNYSARAIRRTAAVCICAVMLLCAGVTAFAANTELKTILGWGGNSEIRQTTDENGNTETTTYLFTDSLTEPVELENGRIYFIVNGEHIDITDTISEKTFSYSYVDSDGYTHYWLVGLNTENVGNYGYAEYIKDENGDWIGGYSARASLDNDGKGPEWLEAGKAELGIPW